MHAPDSEVAMAGKRRATYRGSLRQRSTGTWEWRVSIAGRRHSETFQAASKTAAASLAATRYAELVTHARSRARGVPVDWTWGDLVADVEEHVLPGLSERTQAEYRRVMRRFAGYLAHDHQAGVRVAELDDAHIVRYLDWRQRRNLQKVRHAPRPERVAPRTLAKDRTQLHTILQRAVKLRILPSNPVGVVDRIKVPDREPVLLSPDELERLIAHAGSDMVRVYIIALAESGGRCGSEVLWLRWDDIDWDEGYLRILDDSQGERRTKTRRSRWIPMSARLADVLREHEAKYRHARYSGRTSPWVFHHVGNRRRATAGERIKSLYRAFRGAARRAGIDADLHQHDLRHLRITTWVREGKPIAAVQRAAGHATIRTTEKYTHLVRDDLAVLVEEPEATISVDQLRNLTEVAPPDVRAAAKTVLNYLTAEATR